MPPVMAERELAQIQRQIVAGHLVIRAHDAAPQERPERLDILRVHLAAHVFFSLVRDDLMRESERAQVPIAERLIGRDQVHSTGYGLAHEIVIRAEIRFLDHLAHDVAFAGDGSDHFGLALRSPIADALALVLVLFLAAKIDLIDLDFAH